MSILLMSILYYLLQSYPLLLLSFVEHLLGRLFEFTAAFIYELLLSCLLLLHYGCNSASVLVCVGIWLLGLSILLRVVIHSFILPLLGTVSLISRTLLLLHIAILILRLDHVRWAARNLFLFFRLLDWLFPNDIQHRVFEGFLVFAQAILLPSVIHNFAI